MTACFRSICPVHTLRLFSWHGVCACVVVCTFPHLSSFLFVSPSHMLMNCDSGEVSLECGHTIPSVPSERRPLLCWTLLVHTRAHPCMCSLLSSRSWGCLKPCGKWSSTTTTSGTTASGETASTASSTNASPTTHARLCGSTRRCLCKGAVCSLLWRTRTIRVWCFLSLRGCLSSFTVLST